MTVDERLQRLEVSNRRLRLTLLGLVALVVACEGVKANYERVRVRELIIVDASDKAVASFVGTARGAELSVMQPGKSPTLIIDAGGVRERRP